MTDIEIARSAKLQPIEKIAKKLNLTRANIELYGDYKAKVNIKPSNKPNGKLILVTAVNPTSFGEGKTTVSIGLADGMNILGKRTSLALREPSLGPVFGIKGGATGGGYSQILPMEDINLHFTGDFHAITSANNLLSAIIDNSIFQGNELNIDPDNIQFNRTIDMNDRALRGVSVNYNVKNAIAHNEKFNITAACEIMAILSLSADLMDLKKRLGNILVAFSYDKKPIYCRDLHCEDSLTILLKEAIKPNLVQTIGGTPTFVHCGPFANIAHGCNSIQSTRLSMSLSDYTVTEAGFGADLGAQKFLDVKCRVSGLTPNAVVIVATSRALKLNGGADKNNLTVENVDAISKGICNLIKHVDNIKNCYKLPCIVAINKFTFDTDKEIEYIKETILKVCGVEAVVANVWGKGGAGALELAEKVIALTEQDNSKFTFTYKDTDSIEDKVIAIATKIYGAKDVEFSPKALISIKQLAQIVGVESFPVVIAKTQYSLSDDPNLLGAPKDFTLHIRDVEVRAGAGFVVALAGAMMLMPGLSKFPSAMKMTINADGVIDGLS